MPLPADILAQRQRIAAPYLAGQGIEIGALDAPTPLPGGACARYVDFRTVEKLAGNYPELDARTFVPVDIVDDGERLDRIGNGTLDFLIANHMLEHCENPLGTLRNHLRKVKQGGSLYYAVPDMRCSFDSVRPLTPFEHLVADDVDGGAGSRWAHHLEWARLVNKVDGEAEARRFAEDNIRYAYSIHYHVWNSSTWLELLSRARTYLGNAFEVRRFEFTGTEIVCVLRRE